MRLNASFTSLMILMESSKADEELRLNDLYLTDRTFIIKTILREN